MSVWLTVGGAGTETLETANEVLRALGLPAHQDAAAERADVPWMCEIGGYGCFYHLRRVAAYVTFNRELPPPTLKFRAVMWDRVLRRYYRHFRVQRSGRGAWGLLRRRQELTEPSPCIGRSGAPFAHLMHHVAPLGDYVPIPFDELIVVYPTQGRWEEPEGIGSSHRLLAECQELAQRLQYPVDMELRELDQLRRDEGFIRHTDWRRYALECFVCQALIVGARLSIESGCALRFG